MRRCWAAGLALVLLPGSSSAEVCAPVDCMRRLNLAVPIERVAPAVTDLPAIWHSMSGGLSGRVLYLFEDRTYISTEWADVMPETIVDLGRWHLEGALLMFEADPSVTWGSRERSYLLDRRFLSVRPEAQQDKWWLVGLDDSMDVLDYLPADAFTIEFLAFVRAQAWKPGQAVQKKETLLKHAWRPEYFEKGRRRRTRG